MGFNYLKAIATTFIKTTLKDSKKLKKLQIMYKNTIYIWISRYNKSLFPVKKYWRQQNHEVCHVMDIFFVSSLGKV